MTHYVNLALLIIKDLNRSFAAIGYIGYCHLASSSRPLVGFWAPLDDPDQLDWELQA